jgi:hypothetical protein
MVAAVLVLELPDRIFLLAFILLALTFGILCLGMIEVWFREAPPTMRESPYRAINLWIGALFFDLYLLATMSFAVLGIAALLHPK